MPQRPRFARSPAGLGFALAIALALGVAAPATLGEEWSLPDARMGVRTAPILLLTRADVQADLGLDEVKIASARKAVDALTDRAQSLRGKTGAAVVDERRAIDEAQAQWLRTNLSDEQLTRLSQIDIQWEGPSALVSRPVIAETLALTPTQLRVLTKIIAERNAKLAQGPATPAEESEVRRKTMAVLSNAQLGAWNAMVGEHCRFVIAPTPTQADPAVRQAGHEPSR